MHVIIESARKSAGISGLKSNYPENKKQRGTGYWAAFLGALDYQLGLADEALRKSMVEAKSLAMRNAELERDLNKLREKRTRNGVALVAEQQRWSVDARKDAMELIAN